MAARMLQDSSKSLQHRITILPAASAEKLAEYKQKFLIHAVLIDDEIIDPLNKNLLTRLRSTLGDRGTDIPFFLFSAERESRTYGSILKTGYADIFLKPMDVSMFLQKLQIHLPQQPILKDRLLYSMNTNAEIEIAFTCELIAAAEYGARVIFNRSLQVGEVVSLHGDLFGETTEIVTGRVMSCVPRAGDKSKYEAFLVFVAPKKEIMRAIRLWIKREYIKSKELQAQSVPD